MYSQIFKTFPKEDANASPEEEKEREMSSFSSSQDSSNKSIDIEEDSVDKKEIRDFWNTKIHWRNQFIDIDLAPFTLLEQTPLAKVHFLFTMLNVSQIFVINEGLLVGIITKKEFLKRRDQDIDHEETKLMPIQIHNAEDDEINQNAMQKTPETSSHE